MARRAAKRTAGPASCGSTSPASAARTSGASPGGERARTFQERDLTSIYQEQTADGTESNFFRLESPQREDA